jgi:hypothetical protein
LASFADLISQFYVVSHGRITCETSSGTGLSCTTDSSSDVLRAKQ